MKISCIKSKNDKESFNMFKGFGFNVREISELEDTDKELKSLIENNYKTIILSNEVAGFSEDIIKEYSRDKNVNIIIAPSKKMRE